MAYINKIDINGRTYYLQHLTDGINEARLPTPEKNDELLLRSQVVDSVTNNDSKNGWRVPLSAAQGYSLNAKINAEQVRAEEAEQGLSDDLNLEIQNRINDVNAEETRALAAEQVLTNNLAQEIVDRTNAVSDEKTRAEAAEKVLTNGLNKEIQDRTNDVNAEEARALEAEQILTNNLAQEIVDRTNAVTAEQNRAVGKENEISGKLTDEINRAKGVESNHESRIVTMETFFKEADVDASQEFIDTLKEIQEYIENDKTGASAMAASIQENKTAIQTEKSRAEGVEASLQSQITTEANTARKAEKDNADAIKKLNGDVNTTGSVRNIVDGAISGVVGNAQTYTTLASIEEWINANPGGGSGGSGTTGGGGGAVTTTARYFDTVSALKSASVSTGNICLTRGYSSANDGGEAMYVITDSKIHSDIRSFKLNNGKYANIFNTNNILCYGGDNKGNNANDSVLTNMRKFTDSIYFPGGVYNFESPIKCNIKPSSNDMFNIAHDDHITFNFTGDGFIVNDTRANTVIDSVFKSELSNITFKSPSTAFSVTRTWTPLVRPEKLISNCEFYGQVKFQGTREFVLDGCIIYGKEGQNCLDLTSNINTTINCCTICSETNNKKAQRGIVLNTADHQNEGITISHSIIINTNEGITSTQQTLQVSILDSVIDQCETHAARFHNASSLSIINSYLMIRDRESCATVHLYTTKDCNAYGTSVSNCRVAGGHYKILVEAEDGGNYSRNSFNDIDFEFIYDKDENGDTIFDNGIPRTPESNEIIFRGVGQTTVSGCVFTKGIMDVNGGSNIYCNNHFGDYFSSYFNSYPIKCHGNYGDIGIKMENKGAVFFIPNDPNSNYTQDGTTGLCTAIVEHGLYREPTSLFLNVVDNVYARAVIQDVTATTFKVVTDQLWVQVRWMASCE